MTSHDTAIRPVRRTPWPTRLLGALTLSLIAGLSGCGKDMDLHDDFLIQKVVEPQRLQQMAPQEAVSLRMSNGDVQIGRAHV